MSGVLARQTADEAEEAVAVKAWPALLRRASLLLEEEHYCEFGAFPNPNGPAAIAPWGEAEEGLWAGRDRLPLAAVARDYLQRNAAARLAYGYPVFVRAGAFLPMFTLKARLAADGEAILLERPEAARLNVYALRHAGMPDAEAVRLANELAEGRLEFGQKLARVLGALGLDPAAFPAAPLAPLGEVEQPRWVNRPILFAAPFGAERRAVWNDLVALLKRPPWTSASRTALAGLFEPPPERKAPLIFDLHALGPSQTEAVRTAMQLDLAAIEAAPGAGQMAVVANLIATATAAGERVLYVAARPETAAGMARHMETWVLREGHLSVRLAGSVARERDAIVDTLYRMARDDAQREPAEGQDKPQREKPTRKALAELERFSPKTEPVAASVRQAHDYVRERHLLQRALAAELGPDWTGTIGRRSPLPATREQLAEWRARLADGGGRAPSGLGKLVKSVLGGKQETQDVAAAIRTAVAKLPPDARAQMAELLADPSDLQALGAAVDRLAQFCEWRAALQARQEAVRKLVRSHPDCRALELQSMNHGSQKSAGAREIFRDEWRERLAADPLTLQKQVKALFDLLERGAEPETRAEGQASVRLAQAVQTLATTLRLWTATPTQAERLLPLEPGLFDLVVIDEADRMDLGTALPLLYRARRAVVVGASRGERRRSPAPHRRTIALSRSVADAPAWSEDPGRSLLAQVGAALAEQGLATCRLLDHFRSHPFIADLLSRAFYNGELKVRTNFRNLRRDAPEDMLGLRWRDAEGRLEAGPDGPLNAGEVEEAVALLTAWRSSVAFTQAPRRSFALVSPFAAERQALAVRLARLSLPADRVALLTPEELPGRVVDYLVLLPGLAPDAPHDLARSLAENDALYHDALSAARLGLHVVGDRAACLAAGGQAAAMAAWAAVGLRQGGPAEASLFDPRFEEAFGPADGVRPDAAAPLAKMLRECGYAYQAEVEEGGLRLAYRVLTPHGGRYDVEIDPSLEELSARPGALDRMGERDKAAAALGYQVVRFEPEELLGSGELLLERLQRLI